MSLEANGTAPGSIKTYAGNLELFRQFWVELADRKEIARKDPTVTVIMEWKAYLVDRKLSSISINGMLTTLRRFYEWAISHDPPYYTVNPVETNIIPMIRPKGKSYGKILTANQVKMLLKNNPPYYDTKWIFWEKSYALVMVLLFTGIHEEEATALKVCDINFEAGTLFAQGVRKRFSRYIQMPEIVEIALKLYLHSGSWPEKNGPNDYLFGTTYYVDENGKGKKDGPWHRMTGRGLAGLVTHHVEDVTGQHHVSPVDLRHTCAAFDLMSGITRFQVQEKLGLKTGTNTEIYFDDISASWNERWAREINAEMVKQCKRNRIELDMCADDGLD